MENSATVRQVVRAVVEAKPVDRRQATQMVKLALMNYGIYNGVHHITNMVMERLENNERY